MDDEDERGWLNYITEADIERVLRRMGYAIHDDPKRGKYIIKGQGCSVKR